MGKRDRWQHWGVSPGPIVPRPSHPKGADGRAITQRRARQRTLGPAHATDLVWYVVSISPPPGTTGPGIYTVHAADLWEGPNSVGASHKFAAVIGDVAGGLYYKYCKVE